MTIFEAYNFTKKELDAANIEDFVFEAKQIIKHITGYSSSEILIRYTQALTEFQQNNLTALIKQRIARYPLQYIFGEWNFYGHSFNVGPGVLVPRADTETLIDVCLEYLKDKTDSRVLDLCAGSGCIGITIGCENKNCSVLMLEKYKEAFTYLEKNIERNKAQNVTAVMGDIYEGTCNDGGYDLIVSNPPYIPADEMETISPEAMFEPDTALYGGEDGLMFYRAIISNYTACLKNGGMLAFEVGINEAGKVAELLKVTGFTNVSTRKDLNGIERVVFGTVKQI